MNLRNSLSVLSLVSLSSVAAAQSNWVGFTNETATRIQGPASLTSNDVQEKDMISRDFDKDGDPDLVVVRKTPFSVPGRQQDVLFMNEGGVLVERTAQFAPDFLANSSDARDVLAFDANGDTWLDLVTATTFGDPPRLFINQANDINGDWQGFAESVNWFSPAFPVGPKFCAVYEGDIDNDGDLDLFFSDYDNTLDDRLLVNDGNGVFTDETDLRMTSEASNSVFGTGSFVCDFNGDGWNDILKGSGSFEPVKVVYNDTTGNFSQVQVLPTIAAYMVRAGDYDNDGDLDIHVIDDGQDYTFRNTGNNPDGSVNWVSSNVVNSPLTAGFSGNVKNADFDLDGYLDLAVSDVDVDIPGCDRRFVVLRNRIPNTTGGNFGFTDPNSGNIQPVSEQGVHDGEPMDINGDGFMDLVLGRCTGYEVYMMTPFAVAGTSYCASNENSSIRRGTISAVGSSSLAANDLTLAVQGLPGNVFGLFYYGPNQIQVPFGDGIRCIGGLTQRVFPIQMVSASGLVSFDLDTSAAPVAGGGSTAISPGDDVNFQFWYRDPSGGPAGFNLTDAITISFGL